MSRFHSYLNTAKRILSVYEGEKPFSIALKEFFAAEKKYGSRDRKAIVQLCYSYFRAGHALKNFSMDDAIVAALFLCTKEPNEFLESVRPEWNTNCTIPLEEKWKLLSIGSPCLFPFRDELSDTIDASALENSFLVQPNLFARIRPGHHDKVLARLTEAGITYQLSGEDCLAFLNTTKIDELLQIDKEVVIQDKSSQEVGSLLKEIRHNNGMPLKTWDCCAASGGKSILAWDILGRTDLTVSDVRKPILANLDKRFRMAGIHPYKSHLIDLTVSSKMKGSEEYDLIIADVPCTGSGTWSRTPEQLYYFNSRRIEEFSALQKKIITSIWPALKPGGHLLYITCSVFKKENEDQVKFLTYQLSAKLLRMEWFKGYQDKADTLFAALLQKPL